MQFTNIAFSLLAALAFSPSVLADTHDSCTCHNGDSYNWRITTLACQNYASQGYENSAVAYDTPSGRCTKTADGSYLMGDQWQAACKAIAQSGFTCADEQGTCYAEEGNVKGRC